MDLIWWRIERYFIFDKSVFIDEDIIEYGINTSISNDIISLSVTSWKAQTEYFSQIMGVTNAW